MSSDPTQEVDMREREAWTPRPDPDPRQVAGGAFATGALLLVVAVTIAWGWLAGIVALAVTCFLIGYAVLRGVL